MRTLQPRRPSPLHLHDRSGEPLGLEALEPRALLAAFVYETLAEHFNLPQVIHDLAPPDQVHAGFGAAGVGLGDIDGDGRADFAIAAPGTTSDAGVTVIPGAVFIYSGATGEVIRTLGDGFADFGVSLANVGDWNHDGIPDLAVGSPLLDDNANAAIDPFGAVHIFSGADGAAIRMFRGYRAFSEFGRVIDFAGYSDVMQETPRLLVGAPNDGPANQGAAYLLSGAEVLPGTPGAEIIHSFVGEQTGDRFGAAVHAANLLSPLVLPIVYQPPDILVGAPGNDAAGEDAGRAYLFRGTDGTSLLTLTGDQAGATFGAAVSSARNLTDAYVLVGSPGEDLASTEGPVVDAGAMHGFTPDGVAVLFATLVGRGPGHRFGSDISIVGDINDDTLSDIAVSAPGAPAGQQLRFLTARDFAEFSLFNVTADVVGTLGTIAIAAGDVDGDGEEDVLTVFPGGNRATVVSAFALVPPLGTTRVNPAGTILAYDSRQVPAGLGLPGFGAPQRDTYAFVNGQYQRFDQIPGLTSADTIMAVGDDGTIVGAPVESLSDGSFTFGPRFIVVDGTRTPLASAVTQIVGPNDVDLGTGLNPIGIAAEGSILFAEPLHQRVWVFKDGVLTFLWIGRATHINASGAVLGAIANGASLRDVVRAPNGTTTDINGLSNPTFIADDGAVYGNATSGGLGVWRNGDVVVLDPLISLIPPGETSAPGITVRDVGQTGRVLLELTFLVGRGTVRVEGLYVPGEGARPLDQLVFGPSAPSPYGRTPPTIAFLPEGGDILTVQGVLDSIAEEAPWTLAPGSPVAAADDSVVAGVNILGDVFVSRRIGGQWHGARVEVGAFGGIADVTDLLLYTDPRSGETYLFVTTPTALHWGRVSGTDTPHLGTLSNGVDATPIVSNASIFTSADNRVHLAGVDSNGDLVIYFQNTLFDPSSVFNWTFNNLTTQHIEAQGQSFVPVAGGLTTYPASWGAMHIAYLDSAGSVQTVWWGPGMDLWRTDNLSVIAGAPALHGRLVAYVTPWDGLNVAGTDANGDLVAVWWVPSFGGQWRADRLTPFGIDLDPDSLTSYVTPWGALNIAGRRTDTGEATVYWWAPATNQWHAETLQIRPVPQQAPQTYRFTGRLIGTVAGETQSLFGRRDDGDLTMLQWRPGDNELWTPRSITDVTI